MRKKIREKKPLTPEQQRKRMNIRRGWVSAAGVALVLIAVILLNLIATSLTDHYDLTLDLTASRLYEITNETKTALNELEDSVDITILSAEDSFKKDTYYSKVHTLLQKYQNLGGDKLKISYVDPYTNPNAVQKYRDLASSIQSGSVILSCGDNTRVLNASDFYSMEQSASYSGYYDVTGFQGEQALTSAILSVTNEETPAAYILQGHNESISTSLSTLFTDAGYTANTFNLTESKEIPKDASVLVLSLPQADYTEKEINMIDSFVKDGGDVIVFDGTSCPTDLPVLYAYLKEWGITIQSDMVLDADYNINEATDILAQLTDSENNSALSNSDLTLVTPNAKSIKLSSDFDNGDRTVDALMESRDTSYAKVLTDETEYDSYNKTDTDTDGPFTLAALAEYTGNDKGGQIFVCSAGIMMSDDLMGASSLMNHTFLSNTLSCMQPEIEMISIPSKNLSSEPLVMSTTAQWVVFLLLALIPLVIFIMGIVVFIRRRRL